LALFKAKFDDHYPINSMDELADFYAKQGVNRAEFMRIATSDEVTDKMKSDLALIQKWQVDGTPTLVVDGKYRVTGAKDMDELAAVALWLAKRELGSSKK
jgi:thiol:disulfide interchange protein DsbA